MMEARQHRKVSGYPWLAIWVLAVVAGCTPGPAYHAPTAPSTGRYTASAAPTQTVTAHGPAGGRQVFEYGERLNRMWWRLFHSAALDHAVRRALARNPGLAQAQAALAQAQADAAAAMGVFYPQVTANGGAARQQTTSAGGGGTFPGNTFSLYSGNVTVAYSPDLFGLNRLVARAQQAQVDQQRYLRDAAYLTLEGNVADTLIQEAALRSEIRTTESVIRKDRALLALVARQYHGGAVTYTAVLTQREQLASSEAARASLRQQLAASRHALAALMGDYPATAPSVHVALDDLVLPKHLPVTLPSVLVRQRPDIRASEANLRLANANIGEAVARMYPLLTLTAAFGTQSNQIGSLFLPATRVYDLAAGLTAPIFNGGTLEAQKRAAIAAYEGGIAGYQTVVLAAFQQVADALRALQYDAQTLAFQRHALVAADGALRLSEIQYRDGAVQYLTVLTTEIQDANTRLAYVQARAQRYRDTVALFVALGGGWWPHGTGRTPPPAPDKVHTRTQGHETRPDA
ncbi:MAG: efflux transporter outer membrane subunit [Acidiferrobacteraceae bacterium]